MAKGGKAKPGGGLPIRPKLAAGATPLLPLPVFDEAVLAKETWELKKKALFEDPEGLPLLPADLQARVDSWKRPDEVFEAAFAKRKAALEAAGEDPTTAGSVAPAPAVAAPVVSQGAAVRAIAAGFVLESSSRRKDGDATSPSSPTAVGGGGGGGGAAATATSSESARGLPSVAALESVFRAVHNNEALVSPGSFLWESIFPKAQGKDAATPWTYYNASGKYAVRVFEAGEWRQVFVDDRVPCDADGNCLLPTSSATAAGELWPWLLSKALLKLHARARLPHVSPSRQDNASADGGGGTTTYLDGDAAGSTEDITETEGSALPPLAAADVGTLVHWLTGWLLNVEGPLPTSAIKTSLWASISECVDVEDIGSKKKKKKKKNNNNKEAKTASPKEDEAGTGQPAAGDDDTSETKSAPEGGGAATTAAAGSSDAGGEQATAGAKEDAKNAQADEGGGEADAAQDDQESSLLPFSAPPRRSVLLISTKAGGPRGVSPGSVCTITRARKKGSRTKELLVRGSFNPTPWQAALSREFAALPTADNDEEGTVLLADVVKMLQTPLGQELLQLAGVSSKVVKEYTEEVAQAEAARVAYEAAKKEAEAAIAAAKKGAKKPKKGKGGAPPTPSKETAKALPEEPEVPRISQAAFEASVFQTKDTWVSIGDFHKYFSTSTITFVTERLESSLHQLQAHWAWEKHVAESLDDSTPDESFNATVRSLPQRRVQGDMVATQFLQAERPLLRCHGGDGGSWFVFQLASDPLVPGSVVADGDAQVTVRLTDFDAESSSAKSGNSKAPALARTVATLVAEPGSVAGQLVRVPAGPHTFSFEFASATGYTLEVQPACHSEFGDTTVLGGIQTASDDAESAAADGVSTARSKSNHDLGPLGDKLFHRYQTLRASGSTRAGFYEVQREQGTLSEEDEWDSQVLAWFHVQDSTRLAYNLSLADRIVAANARVTRIDLGTGIETPCSVLISGLTSFPPNGGAGYALVASYQRSLAPLPLPSSPWSFTVAVEPEGSDAAGGDGVEAAAGDKQATADAEGEKLPARLVRPVAWKPSSEQGIFNPNKYARLFRKRLEGLALEATLQARVRVSDPSLYVHLDFVAVTQTPAGDEEQEDDESKTAAAEVQVRDTEQVLASSSTKGVVATTFVWPKTGPSPPAGTRIFLQASIDLRYCDPDPRYLSDGPFVDLSGVKPDAGAAAAKAKKSAAGASGDDEGLGADGSEPKELEWFLDIAGDQPVTAVHDDTEAQAFGALMESWEVAQPGRAQLAAVSRDVHLAGGSAEAVETKKLPKGTTPLHYGVVDWDAIPSFPEPAAASRTITVINANVATSAGRTDVGGGGSEEKEEGVESKLELSEAAEASNSSNTAQPSASSSSSSASGDGAAELEAGLKQLAEQRTQFRAEEKAQCASTLEALQQSRQALKESVVKQWEPVWNQRREYAAQLKKAAEAAEAAASSKAGGKKGKAKGKAAKKKKK